MEGVYAMRHLSLLVDGMCCRRCVRDVTARLRDVPGVQTVVADLSRSQVRLSGTMAVADVLDAFAGSTHAARLLDDLSSPPDP
jgi:copper chaperone CopZ